MTPAATVLSTPLESTGSDIRDLFESWGFRFDDDGTVTAVPCVEPYIVTYDADDPENVEDTTNA